VARSRRDGIAAAFGMGLGGVGFASLALLGLHALIASAGWLYLGLKLAGGLYLLVLAVGLWRGAARPLVIDPVNDGSRAGTARSFALGLATQLSNPKAAVVYGSVFAALLPPDPSRWLFAALPPLVFLIETGWYAAVAAVFSVGGARAAYLGAKAWIDRCASAVLGALGVRLILETGRPG